MEKAIVIVCAFNEEKYIGRTIDLLRKTNLDFDLFIVDDGSTDRTVEIARQKKVIVFSLSKNVGKANAFFFGIKEALKKQPRAVVTIDADMVRIPRKGLHRLISIASEATVKKRARMVVSGVFESGTMRTARLPQGGYLYSGIRSFSLPALYLLRQSGLKKIPKRYGLELFLNRFFKEEKIKIVNHGFIAERATRTISREEQVEDIFRTERKWNANSGKVKKELGARRKIRNTLLKKITLI